jgi:hypothetical protein
MKTYGPGKGFSQMKSWRLQAYTEGKWREFDSPEDTVELNGRNQTGIFASGFKNDALYICEWIYTLRGVWIWMRASRSGQYLTGVDSYLYASESYCSLFLEVLICDLSDKFRADHIEMKVLIQREN